MNVKPLLIKVLLQVIILLLMSRISTGQEVLFDDNYKFSDSILYKLSSDSLNYEAAWKLSYIGEYKTTLTIWDRDEQPAPTLTKDQINHFARFKPVKAADFIVKRAKQEQIIIINEAHHQPYHRVFTTSLLLDLYKQGYRYFGAETLSSMDTELNTRKYPTKKTGFYTQEPFYGNLIREALKIGFEVFPYESNIFDDTIPGISIREIEQAKNIKKILDKDPKAKIIIHCGFDHLAETDLPGWGKAMAGRLYELTGINPFTIDQVRLTEHSSPEYENPYFKLINLDYYAMFIDSAGNTFNGPPGFKDYDARVCHPRTKWKHGRAHWVFENKRQAYFVNNKITTSFPCLVYAYIAYENLIVDKLIDLPIPYDIIELKDQNEKKALSLKKGKYNLIIRDAKGVKQQLKVKM